MKRISPIFASNDYLGISTKLDLENEFLKDRYLLSSASARLLTGSSPEYKALERTVAGIFNKEAALKWLANGAQPTDTVKAIFKNEGILKAFNDAKKVK